MTPSAANKGEGPRFGVRGATHDYSGVVVLRDVDFELRGGEVHGLVGENGSGKSTLIKVLTGAVKRAGGTLYLDGEEIDFSSPAQAQERGIGVVHQDYQLFPYLSVRDNVFGLSRGLPRHRLSRAVDKGAMRRAVEEQLEELEIEIPASALAGTLGPAEKKFVEIARAMLLRPRFLILDEPTASLEPEAANAVLALLDRLRSQGLGLCFVSHRLDEVLRISDSVTVLRDGKRVAQHLTSELDEKRLVGLIVSEEGGVPAPPTRRGKPQVEGEAKPVLKVNDLILRRGAAAMSFEVEQGEIFGLTGLLGSGPSRVVRLVAGAEKEGIGWGVGGTLEVGGGIARIRDPRAATRLGIGYIPEDRKGLGLVPDASVMTNIALASLGKHARHGIADWGAIEIQAEECRTQMKIRTASLGAPVRTLSGGNQQKVLIARWTSSGCRLLAVEEPTHGVDVGGKAQILQLLRDYADDGGAIIVASTEPRELLELCDRIAVLRHGELVDQIVPSAKATKSGKDLDEQAEALERIMVGQAGRAAA